MKLYNNTEEVMRLDFSLEEFVDYYSNSVIISEEALSDYLFKVKDLFFTIGSKLSNSINDKAVMEISYNKFEVLHIIKRIKFIEVKDFITSKPEGFNGKYIDYTLDLINVSNNVIGNIEETLNSLKTTISIFINEYNSDKIMELHNSVHFKITREELEKNYKEIRKYFKIGDKNTKVKIKNVLKSLNDIEPLYKNIEVLDSVINISKIEYIGKLTNEVSELVDSLIDQNSKTKVLEKNEKVKKELIDALNIAAREVELINYIYSNVFIFYGNFKNLIDDLVTAERTINN